jgi:thioredoxin 1
MRIGELARRSGTSARSIRYYEQQGLMVARRQANGYRDYDEAHLRLVGEIRSLRQRIGQELHELQLGADPAKEGNRMITAQGVVTVNEATFDRTVLQAQLPVLADFWAEWCPPCRWLSPIVEDLATEQTGKLLVTKVNADENPGLVRRYGTLSLPSLLVFVGGVERGRIVGARPKGRLLTELAQFLPAS